MLYTIQNTRQHTVYKDSKGNKLVGTTTALGILAKPALYRWYFEQGKSGEDPFRVKDIAADIGTIAHALIMCNLHGWELDRSNLVPENISRAENSVISYLEWEKGKKIQPVIIESQLVDESLGYGGTVDLYADIDSEKVLVDFKTGKGIWPEMHYQVAAYWNLLEINGHMVDKAVILNIPKDETTDFQTKTFTDMTREFKIFRHCLAIYKLQKEKNGTV